MRKKRKVKPTSSAQTKQRKGKPAVLFTSDLHVRDTAPECRSDNYVEAVFKKLEFIKDISEKYMIDIVNAGDIGDKSFFVKRENKKDNLTGWTAQVYNRFVDMFLNLWQRGRFFCVAGNHDLPGHDIANLKKSVLYGLMTSQCVHLLNEEPEEMFEHNISVYGCSWGREIPTPKPKSNPDQKNILVIHKMIINQLPLWPGQKAPKAMDILKQNPEYDVIVSGDNHNTFVAEYDGRLLVNPGSMMRTTTKQVDHKPCLFLYYPESNTIEKIYYPIEDSDTCISTKHVEKKNQITERTGKYADLINTTDLSDLKTFKENTEIFLSNGGGISDDVANYIRGFANHEEPEPEI